MANRVITNVVLNAKDRATARVYLDNGDELDGLSWIEIDRVTPNWSRIIKIGAFLSDETKIKENEPEWVEVSPEEFRAGSMACQVNQEMYFRGGWVKIFATKTDGTKRQLQLVQVPMPEPRIKELSISATKTESQTWEEATLDQYVRAASALDNNRPFCFKGQVCRVLAVKRDKYGRWLNVEYSKPEVS